MKMFDIRHPFFRPLWRRIGVVAICLGWAAVEIAGGHLVWALIFAGIGAYCAYEFFIAFDPANYRDRD